MSDEKKMSRKGRKLRLVSHDEMEDVFEIGVGQEETSSSGRDLIHRRWSNPGFSDELSEEKRDDFFGVGPKGYTRSDERIFEDICEKLTSHHEIDATDLIVQVHEGEVFLSGRVHPGNVKATILTLVQAVPGVRNIQSELYVTKDSTQKDTGPRAVTKNDLGLN